MASHSEIAVVTPADQQGPPKRRRSRTAQTSKKSQDKTAKTDQDSQTDSTGTTPVMKLRMIESAGKTETGTSNERSSQNHPDRQGETPQIIHMPPSRSMEAAENDPAGGQYRAPPSQDGEPQVTDPELLELLEQLSVTIDTANTVLDAAANLPGDDSSAGGEEPAAAAEGPAVPSMLPEQAFAHDNAARTGADGLRPLAERLASRQTPEPPRRKRGSGLGILANAALTGLIFTAGVGWLVHTNPWLLEGRTVPPEPRDIAALGPATAFPDLKDQAQLAIKGDGPREVAAAAAVPGLSSFAPPPDGDPVPMEVNTTPAPAPAVLSGQSVRGSAGQPISLAIALPADTKGTEISIMIQGVPDGAELSDGKALGGGNWLVNETRLDGLTLNTGEDFKPGEYELEVIAVGSDGKVPEARKLAVSVTPPGTAPIVASTAPGIVEPDAAAELKPASAAAAPEQIEPSLTPNEERTILNRGETLLREGDVAGARLLLEYAASRGSNEAMVKLAKSYDPDYLARLGVRGVQPDTAKATHWYDRAAKAAAQ